MSSNHLIICHPLLLQPSVFPSTRVFPNELALCIRWPKYWSFICSISPFNEYSGQISLSMNWLDLLAVQGSQESSPTSSSTTLCPYSTLFQIIDSQKKNCQSLYLLREKAMAPHSSTLAWKIPWKEEPDRLQSMGSLGVGHD